MAASLPHVIAIQVNQSGGSARANATVLITNNNTGETATVTCNSSGQALYDAGNFTKGYTDGDSITAKQVVSYSDMEFFVTANGRATAPTWVQVENETKQTIKLNTARVKLNLTRNLGGLSINITQN